MTTSPTRPAGRAFFLLLAACLAMSLIAVAYPIYVIRPFRAQGPRELAAALMILRWRGVATVVSALAAIVALVRARREQPGRGRRVLAGAGVGALVVLALLAQVNVYEIMFHPAGPPAFAPAADVRLDGDEKVIAVRLGREARAYPVRSVSYHHMINDVVDGKGIVATY